MKQYLLILLVFISACTAPATVSQGIELRAEANPSQVFSNGETNLFIDITNKDTKPYRNLKVNVFDPGVFMTSVSCDPSSFTKLDKGAVVSSICTLKAGSVRQASAENIAWADIRFSSTMGAVQPVEVISQNEYESRVKTGTLAPKPRIYSFSDKNLQLDIEFSDEPPLVAKRKSEFVLLTVRNIGNGFIEKLPAGSIRIRSDITGCSPPEISPIGRNFPRITCALKLPDPQFTSSHNIIVEIDYDYDVKKSVSMTVFGGGAATTAPAPGYAWPTASRTITLRYGAPDPSGKSHKGIDIGGSPGDPVTAAADGIVEKITLCPAVDPSCGGGYGTYVLVKNIIDGRYAIYAHLSGIDPAVTLGAGIAKGAGIGAMGDTGRATGVHLHFEIRRGPDDTAATENPCSPQYLGC